MTEGVFTHRDPPQPTASCPVCLEDMSPSDEITGHVENRVEHVFHELCVLRCRAKDLTGCPLCRRDCTLIPSPQLLVIATKSEGAKHLIPFLLRQYPEISIDQRGEALLIALQQPDAVTLISQLLTDRSAVLTHHLGLAIIDAVERERAVELLQALLAPRMQILPKHVGQAVSAATKHWDAVPLITLFQTHHLSLLKEYRGQAILSAIQSAQTDELAFHVVCLLLQDDPPISPVLHRRAVQLSIKRGNALHLIQRLLTHAQLSKDDGELVFIDCMHHPDSLSLIQELLNHHPDMLSAFSLSLLNRAIMTCIGKPHFTEVLRILLTTKAPISIHTRSQAVVRVANVNDPLDAMQLLLENHAAISVEARGEAVLCSLKQRESVGLLRLLLAHNAQLTLEDHHQAIQLSVHAPHALELLTLLLNNRPFIRATDCGEALVHAVLRPTNRMPIIEKLLCVGCVSSYHLGRAVIAAIGTPQALMLIRELLTHGPLSDEDRQEAIRKIIALDRVNGYDAERRAIQTLLSSDGSCTIL